MKIAHIIIASFLLLTFNAKVASQQIGVTGKASIDACLGFFLKLQIKTKEEGRKRATADVWKKFKATNFSAPGKR